MLSDGKGVELPAEEVSGIIVSDLIGFREKH